MEQKGQLLVLDDEIEITQSLRRQFRKKYDVHTAETVDEAYEIMKREPIHVIISDQRMPNITGTEFFKKLKNDFPNAVRLILTGFSDIKAVISAINDGNVFRYITKPWDPVELDSIIEQAFDHYFLIKRKQSLMQELLEINKALEERVRSRTLELEKLNEELRELNRQKDAFLGMAAHDLRNPLNGIIGFSMLLLDETKIKENQTLFEYTDAIMKSSEYMLNLLNRLLDISKIQRGKLHIAPETLPLEAVISNIVRLNAKIGEQKGITLKTSIQPGLPPLIFDRESFTQVLNNLIHNAIKFSGHGTTVTIDIKAQNGIPEVSVIDQGTGIRLEDISKIFGEFEQGSNHSNTCEKGYGLGLAICKKIVEAHGSVMEVESEIGKGSRFFFKVK